MPSYAISDVSLHCRFLRLSPLFLTYLDSVERDDINKAMALLYAGTTARRPVSTIARFDESLNYLQSLTGLGPVCQQNSIQDCPQSSGTEPQLDKN
jgi:hypothetical protein